MSYYCKTGLVALFSQTPYQITTGSINIQNIATGQSFIGKYSQNQFTVPVGGGLSTPLTLDIINPTTGQVVDTINDKITFSLGEANQCNAGLDDGYISNLTGYSTFFGPIITIVVLNYLLEFGEFNTAINTAFQTNLNGESYSISANSVFIQIV